MLITKHQQPWAVFVISFVVCTATATALVAYAPESFLDFWLLITISSTKAIGYLLGMSVTSSVDIMTVNGFAMQIITQCTALHYVIILSAAILLYTRHSIQYRLIGVFVSFILVVAINAIRLIVTGLIGSISWDAFVIVHDYLWVVAFSLLILGIWIAWADRRCGMTISTGVRAVSAVIASTAAFAVLLMIKPVYGNAMAYICSIAFKWLVNDPFAGIVFDGNLMRFSNFNGVLSANFTPELMVLALYIGLIISIKESWCLSMIRRSILGLLVLLSVCVVIIAGGAALALTSGRDTALVFLWTGHGVLLVLPVILWRLLCKTNAGCSNNEGIIPNGVADLTDFQE